VTKAQKIAEYMVGTGIQETTTGNYIFGFDEINRRFGANIPENMNLYHEIVCALFYGYRHMICDMSDPLEESAFNFIFWLEFCPNIEDSDESC